MQAQKEKTQAQDTQASEYDDGEDELPFNEIDQLQNHGINGGDINKLKAAGLCTVVSCIMT